MRGRWVDWALGIGLGLVIGLGVLVYFVFVHSEGTIDAPKLNESGTAGRATTGAQSESSPPAHSGSPEEPARQPAAKGPSRPVPVVRVIGGAPPTDAGPKQLTFHKGEKVRFEIDTDEPFSFEIRGLDIKQSIAESSVISFPARQLGQFPVIATATLIGVADLQIKPPR
jgi:hypothetical protein